MSPATEDAISQGSVGPRPHMGNNALVRWAKRSPTIYNTFKLLRDFPQFPKDRSDRFEKLPTIWKIFPKTMVPPVRLYNFADAVDRVNRENVAGSIVECGVWSGGALAFAALWHQRSGNSTRHYHGFDSFEGLPPPTPEDNEVFERYVGQRNGARPVPGEMQVTGICKGDAADSVRQFFVRAGVDPACTHFHVGWFQDTLPHKVAEVSPIAILRIDGDWYESTKVCLDTLYDSVSDGGVVIIDDYGAFSGCKRAVDDFREARAIAAPLEVVDEHCVWWIKPKTARD